MLSQLLMNIQDVLGIEAKAVSHTERLISGFGALLGILGILLVSQLFLDMQGVALIVASMGASAVLLFAVPHGPLSQPWALLGGHTVSAVIGVSCALSIPDIFLAASLAVGLAVLAMHYLRCIHPPGGATAISAVIGGAEIHALGYQYVLTPVLLNALVILTVAVVFNAPFTWRRYPVWLKPREKKDHYDAISHADLVYALSEIDSFIDVSEQDLLRIYSLATQRNIDNHLDASQIRLWHYYCNDSSGDDWSIRQIVDESSDQVSGDDTVIYKVMAGDGLRSTAHISRKAFARWARSEVVANGVNWREVSATRGIDST